MTYSGSACPITDDAMVLINPWVPAPNWRDVGDPPITILALYLEAGWLPRDGSGHVVRLPFKRRSGTVEPPVRSLVTKIATAIAAAEPTTSDAMEIDIFKLAQHVLSDNPIWV